MAAAGEIRIEGSLMLVALVPISSRGIRLPDFHECMRNRPPVLIQDSSAHDDSFAERLARMLPRQIRSLRVDAFFPYRRAGYLRQRVGHVHQWFRGRAFDRGYVRRVQVIRLRTWVRPPVTRYICHTMMLLPMSKGQPRALGKKCLALAPQAYTAPVDL
jgi:hypothetical protein